MLKFTPKSITASILLFFGLVLGVQHLSFFELMNGRRNGDPILHQALAYYFPFLGWIERTDYDLHLRALNESPPHSDVVIVAVNEKSIQDLGQFPFSRSVYSPLIKNLEAAGAKSIAFDITFPELEQNESIFEMRKLRAQLEKSGRASIEAIRLVDERIKAMSGDNEFAQALKSANIPIVMGFAFAGSEALQLGAKTIGAESLELLKKHDIRRIQVTSDASIQKIGDQIPVIPHKDLMGAINAKGSLGIFIPDHDVDSVVRRAYQAVEYEGIIFSGIAARSVAGYLGVELALVKDKGGYSLQDSGREGILKAPIAPDGAFLVRYYGGEGKFPYYEFSDVVNGKIDPLLFKNKIVFVGATAVGLKDLRASPFSQNYPGVEVHASIASNILKNEFIEKDARYFFYGYLTLLLLAGLTALAVYRLHPIWAFAFSTGLIGFFQVAAQLFFFDRGVVVPTLLPSLAAWVVLTAGVLYRYFTEENEKKHVRSAFSRYVSSAVVEEILKDHSKLRLGGQKKELTVMFCDLVGFTKLAEQMDASFVTQLLNEYFTRMTKIILRNQGTLDKYMGDAIMCFWGAPLELQDHAKLACKSAVEMERELHSINEEWKLRHGITIGMRIGIHSGDMAVGNMGSEQVFSYTVMGDNVNLASRLEGVNNVYGTRLLVSQDTALRAGNGFIFRPVDIVRVKGKEDAVSVLELIAEKAESASIPEWMHAFSEGLESYRHAEWDLAEAAFGTCLQLKPDDGPSKVFLERIKDLKASQPESWDGVWKLQSK